MMKDLELRQLVYFDAIVRYGGFTRAAQSLHVSQPAISTQLRQLERSLGATLLHRSTRRVTLTPAGEQFLIRTRSILQQLEAARSEMQAHSSVMTGQVRLGATQVLGSLPLARLMSSFRARYPHVTLALRSGLVDTLLDQLDDGDLDVVIGPRHGTDPRFLSVRLAAESLVLITPPDFGREVTDLRQVSELPFVCLRSGSGLHAILTGYADEHGIPVRVDFETHSPNSIRELVSAGMGVALVARSSAVEPGYPVQVHDLDEAPPHPPICAFLSRRNQPSAAATAFFRWLHAEGADGNDRPTGDTGEDRPDDHVEPMDVLTNLGP